METLTILFQEAQSFFSNLPREWFDKMDVVDWIGFFLILVGGFLYGRVLFYTTPTPKKTKAAVIHLACYLFGITLVAFNYTLWTDETSPVGYCAFGGLILAMFLSILGLHLSKRNLWPIPGL